jgi:hypothetical protein
LVRNVPDLFGDIVSSDKELVGLARLPLPRPLSSIADGRAVPSF